MQVKPGTLHVGVDLALDRNVALVMDERADTIARFSFPNDRMGYDYLDRRLEQLRQHHQAAEVLVAMEPTNYFWKLLAAELEQQGRPYRLNRRISPPSIAQIPPRTVQLFRFTNRPG